MKLLPAFHSQSNESDETSSDEHEESEPPPQPPPTKLYLTINKTVSVCSINISKYKHSNTYISFVTKYLPRVLFFLGLVGVLVARQEHQHCPKKYPRVRFMGGWGRVHLFPILFVVCRVWDLQTTMFFTGPTNVRTFRFNIDIRTYVRLVFDPIDRILNYAYVRTSFANYFWIFRDARFTRTYLHNHTSQNHNPKSVVTRRFSFGFNQKINIRIF